MQQNNMTLAQQLQAKQKELKKAGELDVARPVISQEKKIHITANFAEALRLRQLAGRGANEDSDEFEEEESDEDSQPD